VPGQKFITNSAGNLVEVAAPQSSAGAGDAGKLVALDSTGRIDTSMMPTGIAADTASIVSSENLAAGDFVNVYNNAGTPTVRKADASGGAAKRAHGFVLAATTSPAAAIVYFEGTNSSVSGMTAGDVYLSGTTAGAATVTAPSTSAYIVQKLGVAVAAGSINVEIDSPIVLA
jgi:hypothetical protein